MEPSCCVALGLSLSEWAEIGQLMAGVASVILLASIFLVRHEVKQQAETSRVALITGMTSLLGSVSQIFIENPHMQKYFYGGATPIDQDAELAQVIAMRMADALDHAAAHLDLMPPSTERAWIAYVSDMGTSSPTLKSYVESKRAGIDPSCASAWA